MFCPVGSLQSHGAKSRFSYLSFSILYSFVFLCVCLSVFGNVTKIDVNYSTDEPEVCYIVKIYILLLAKVLLTMRTEK